MKARRKRRNCSKHSVVPNSALASQLRTCRTTAQYNKSLDAFFSITVVRPTYFTISVILIIVAALGVHAQLAKDPRLNALLLAASAKRSRCGSETCRRR